jgi:hypothetical protein
MLSEESETLRTKELETQTSTTTTSIKRRHKHLDWYFTTDDSSKRHYNLITNDTSNSDRDEIELIRTIRRGLREFARREEEERLKKQSVPL